MWGWRNDDALERLRARASAHSRAAASATPGLPAATPMASTARSELRLTEYSGPSYSPYRARVVEKAATQAAEEPATTSQGARSRIQLAQLDGAYGKNWSTALAFFR